MERIERRKRRLWNLHDGLPFDDEDSDCSVVESIMKMMKKMKNLIAMMMIDTMKIKMANILLKRSGAE